MWCSHACKYHLLRPSNPEKESRWLLSPLYYFSEQHTDWNNILRSGGRWASIFNVNIYDDANLPERTNELKRWAIDKLAQSPNVKVDTLDNEFWHPSKKAFSQNIILSCKLKLQSLKFKFRQELQGYLHGCIQVYEEAWHELLLKLWLNHLHSFALNADIWKDFFRTEPFSHQQVRIKAYKRMGEHVFETVFVLFAVHIHWSSSQKAKLF